MDDSTSLDLARAREGDEHAKGALLARQVQRLRAFVRGQIGTRLRTRENSDDLAHSVVREALVDFDRASRGGAANFRKWLRVTARHKVQGRGRFWNRDRRALDRVQSLGEETVEPQAIDGTPSGAAIAREDLARLEQAFASLPPDWAEVVLLVRTQGLSHAEAARRLGRTESATRTMLSRALARLAAQLEEERPPEA